MASGAMEAAALRSRISSSCFAGAASTTTPRSRHSCSTAWRKASTSSGSAASICQSSSNAAPGCSSPLRVVRRGKQQKDGFAAVRAPETAGAPAGGTKSAAAAATTAAAAAPVRSPSAAEEVRAFMFELCTAGALSPLLTLLHVQKARLLGPSIFNASKLRVLLPGKDDEEPPLQHPRIYTLTHNDITAKITLAVSRKINKAQMMGWYSRWQRDEVVAEWRRVQGEMSLHVHCHISGTNHFHRLIAKLRFYIFHKELPLVLAAFVHGDRDLFRKHPELQMAPVWMYFHSNVEDYNQVECWGPLVDATKRGLQSQGLGAASKVFNSEGEIEPQFLGAAICMLPCDCCSRHATVIPIPESLNRNLLQTQELTAQLPSLTKEGAKSSLFRLC